MAKVNIENDTLIVRIQGIRKLATLKSELTFPLANVTGATVDPGVRTDYPNFTEKVSGIDPSFFGLYTGGTFKQDGDRVFWDVRKPENAIVIALANEAFARLIIEVDDPQATVKEIEQAITR